MAPTVVRTLRIDEDQWAAMRDLEDRDGVPVVEQVRRGIRLWLDTKGVTLTPPQKGRKRNALPKAR